MKTTTTSGTFSYNCVNVGDGFHNKFAPDDLVTLLEKCTLVEGYKHED